MDDDTVVEFRCECSESLQQSIKNILPLKYRTKVVTVQELEGLLHLDIRVKCTYPEEVASWLHQYEDINYITYTIRTTKHCTGKYLLMKQYLVCHHNTRSKIEYSMHSGNRTKNTNCPSAITLTLHAVKKRYKGKDKENHDLLKDTPLEIQMVVSHNHSIGSADALRFRPVSAEVKQKLMDLFSNGHSPASALESIKIDISFHDENSEKILSDRKYCPDYMYCYHLYMKIFKKEYGPLEFNKDGKDFLQKKIAAYNEEMKEVCADKNNSQMNENLTEENEQLPCLDSEMHRNAEIDDSVAIVQDSTERGLKAAEEIFKTITNLIGISPTEVVPAIERMSKNIKKLTTPSAFASACFKFGSGYCRRNRRSRIPLQPTSITRRKSDLSGKNPSVGGRPRSKTIDLRKNRQLKTSTAASI